jgi:hypothetical protein
MRRILLFLVRVSGHIMRGNAGARRLENETALLTPDTHRLATEALRKT